MNNPFVGAWRMVSWELRPADGGEPYYPLGKDATGMIMYSADGHMAVVLSKPARAPFEQPWLFEGSPAEKIAAMESYMSYAGRYEVREGIVIHHVEFSLFPNWVGTAQERFYKFEGNRLTLSAAPFEKDGVEQTAVLVWEKVGTKH